MIIAINQYGDKIILQGKHPRKELIEKVEQIDGPHKVSKMYVDDKNGQAKHVGYVIGNLWFTLFTCQEWQGKAI
jgi:hypothetical protein